MPAPIFQENVRLHLGKSLLLSNGPVGSPPDAGLDITSADFIVGSKAAEATGLALATKLGSGDAAGTDKAGANTTLKPGASTGAGVPGTVKVQRGAVGSAGAVANALVDAFIVPPRKAVAANNTVQGLFEVALPDAKGCSGVIEFAVFTSDGTDHQMRSGIVRFSAVNKGGVYTSEIVVVNEAAAVSTGTLTCTWAILTGANKITIRFTANSSLTPTVQHITFTLRNNSEQAITVL